MLPTLLPFQSTFFPYSANNLQIPNIFLPVFCKHNKLFIYWIISIHTCTALACRPQMIVLVSDVNKGAFDPLFALWHCSGDGFSSGVFPEFSDMYTVLLP